MLTQTDLFTPAATGDADAVLVVAQPQEQPIAVPCGFRDRHNNPCHRLANWPIMDGEKQMLCRDRPMIHCAPACFKGDFPTPDRGVGSDDVIWDQERTKYDDVE